MTTLAEQLQPILTRFAEEIATIVREMEARSRADLIAQITGVLGVAQAPPVVQRDTKPAKILRGALTRAEATAPKPAKSASTLGRVCSVCKQPGHYAKSCGRTSGAKPAKGKRAASDDEDHGELAPPEDPRVALIRAVATKTVEEHETIVPVIERPALDPTDKREVCPVHGWVGRTLFQRNGHEHCEAPIEVCTAPEHEPEETRALPMRQGRQVRDVPRSKSTLPHRQVTATREAAAELGDVELPPRPATRGECPDERPCPWVGCRYHLAIDVDPETGSLKLNHPHLELEDMPHTCALDVADLGEQTLDVVGRLLNVSRERVRQIETRTFPAAMASAMSLGIDRETVVEGFAAPEGYPRATRMQRRACRATTSATYSGA